MSLPKFERQKLQRLSTKGGAVYGSVGNLMKLATYQYQRLDNFYIQSPCRQSLILLRVNSREGRRFPDSKTKIGVWTWHTLIN